MSKLLPCPWCKREMEMIKAVIPAYDHAKDCPLYGIAVPYKNWNTRNEWIPIKEQWPPTDGYYVVWFQDQTSTLKLEDGNWYWGNMDVMDEEDQEYVTHWQPIRAPKGE